MNEIILEQGSEAWLEFRRSYRMASETPAIMGLSPYSKPDAIRQYKLTGKTGYVNAAMRRGTEQEPICREHYESETGHLMRPAVFLNGDYGASVDGISLDNKFLIEIKSPGLTSERFIYAAEGKLTRYDMAQVQHQLMVTNAEFCDFLLWNGSEYSCTRVFPDEEIWKAIRAAWDAFWPTIAERSDSTWEVLAQSYIAAKAKFDKAEAELEKAKESLISARQTNSDRGFGVSISETTRGGSINWKAVTEKHLKGVDLSEFQNKDTKFFKVIMK